MAQSFLGQKRLRKYYGKIREVLEMPNLIEVQKASYDLFLKSGDQPEPTAGEGIMGVFQSVFPIKDFNETSVLEFVKYDLEALVHPEEDINPAKTIATQVTEDWVAKIPHTHTQRTCDGALGHAP